MDLSKLRDMPEAEAIKAAAEYAGVAPVVLDRMWTKESSRGKNMTSPAGAQGHFQQMPKTLATLRKRHGAALDPNDFYDGLYMAAEVMKENMGASKGNVADALRRYNSGWDPKRWDNPETNDYVSYILGNGEGMSKGTTDSLSKFSPDEQALLTGRASDVKAETAAMGSDSEGTLTGVTRAATTQAMEDAAALASRNGGTGSAIVDQVLKARAEAVADVGKAVEQTFTPTETQDLNNPTFQHSLEQEQRDFAAAQYRGSIGFIDKAGAAIDQMATTSLIKLIGKESFPTDPNYNYMRNIDEKEQGLSSDERDRLRDAQSQAHEDSIRADIERDRLNGYKLFSGGTLSGLMWSLGSGLVDPVSWGAGLGTTKVFHLAGIGARALATSGRTGLAVGSLAAEAAVGNVLLEGTIDAAGGHVTLNDYALSAATGLGIGAAMSPWALKGYRNQAEQALFRKFEADAIEGEKELWLAAQKNLGPDATETELKVEADRLEAESIKDLIRTSTAAVPEGDQIMSRNDLDPEGPPITGLHTEDDIKRLGLDAKIADPTTRAMVAEHIVRAERFVKENGLENITQKSTVLDAVGMESTAAILLRSKSPVMKMVAATLLESSTGAGGRRRTAALAAHMREQQYMGTIMGDYSDAYTAFRISNGGSAWKDSVDGKMRVQFDTEVAAVINARRMQSPYMASHPSVIRAADTIEAGYNRMRLEQQAVGTVGSARLGDTSVGYIQQMIDANKVMNMDIDEMRAFQKVLSRQFQTRMEFDQKFSDMLAVKYTERARDRASNAHMVPGNITDPYAADMVRDSLKALGISDLEVDKAMGRFSRGGPGYTKQRLDIDVMEEVTRADGSTFLVGDLFNKDVLGMYRSYARRTASEVSLAQYGVMGKQGMKVLRKSAFDSGASDAELGAFDQIAAELFNEPFNGVPNQWMDNARILTSLSRLGGMGFTQMAEYMNGLGAVGLMHTFKAITALPRMMNEIKDIKAGKIPNNPILRTIDPLGGVIGSEPYRMVGLHDVIDNSVQQFSKEDVSIVSRMVRAGGNIQAKLSMHRAIHTAQQRGMAEQIVSKAMKMVRDGGDDKALADMGITPALAKALKKDFKNLTKWDKDGVLTEFDITKATDKAAAMEFVQAVRRGSAQIIQQTFIGETGKWAHSDFLKMLTQFRSFSITSIEKQWGRQVMIGGAARAVGLLIGSAAFAAPIYMARTMISSLGLSGEKRDEFLERRFSPVAMSTALMNYVSIGGLASDVMNFAPGMADMVTGGEASKSLGIQARGMGTGITDQIPTAGWINDVASGNPHKMLKALPFMNLPYLQPILNALK